MGDTPSDVIASLLTEVKALSANVSNLREQVAGLQATVSAQASHIGELKSAVQHRADAQERACDNCLRDRVLPLQSRANEHDSRLGNHSDRITRIEIAVERFLSERSEREKETKDCFAAAKVERAKMKEELDEVKDAITDLRLGWARALGLVAGGGSLSGAVVALIQQLAG